ncbi:MAG: hypothetical protein RBR08_00765 [Desulforegulaceae bacterium]|nr:hypothetical protein [Desulforegulaceae bacterium]
MTNLIFPYIGFDNPLVEKTKDSSLISINTNKLSLDGLYSEIYYISEDICEKIKRLERLYLEKSYYDKNFDFYNFILNKEENLEIPEQIVNELKFGISSIGTDKSFEEKIVFSGLFLQLFEKYETEKKSIDYSFLEIQKREKEIFNYLTNEKDEINIKDEKASDGIPQHLITKRLMSWFELYFYLGMPSFELVTDKRDYINILFETGFILENQKSDPDVFYLLDFEFLVNKSKFSFFKNMSLKKSDKRIKISVFDS